MPRPKKETLYSNKNNVDINNLINNLQSLNSTGTTGITGGTGSAGSSGQKKIIGKNNKLNEQFNQYGGRDDSDDKDDDEDEDEDSDSDDDNNENDNDLESISNESDDLDGEKDLDDEKALDDEPEGSEADEEESDKGSEKGSEKGSDYEKDLDEDTVKKNCYSKYAAEADEVDLEELFADDEFKLTKTARLSKPVLFKYEKVRLLSTRAKQLANGAKPMIKNTEGLSSKEIALLELKNKLIPMIIERPIPNSGVERWKLSELEIID